MKVTHAYIRVIALLAGIPLAAACTATKMERPSDEQIAPFSEHTIAMAAELQFGLQQADALLTRKFAEDADSPEVIRFAASRDQVNRALRAIVIYSIEVVDLAESDPGEGVNDVLAGYVETLAAEIRQLRGAQPYLTDLDYDAQFAAIREQERLPDGLHAAQPIIDDVAGIVESMLYTLTDTLVAASDEIDTEIQAEHAAVLRHRTILIERQARVLEQLELVNAARAGDDDAWAGLLEADEELRTVIGARGKRTPKHLAEAESLLVGRLDTISAIETNIQPSYELYLSRSRELDQQQAEGLGGARRARIAVVLWARGHRRFASGETGPSGIRAIYAALLGFAVSQGSSILP